MIDFYHTSNVLGFILFEDFKNIGKVKWPSAMVVNKNKAQTTKK
jgi:hypothetical protein